MRDVPKKNLLYVTEKLLLYVHVVCVYVCKRTGIMRVCVCARTSLCTCIRYMYIHR